jgi:oxygen-independent coproporphyrinogen-3 oxidase
MLESPPPLALYVHIPWCVKKCPYCDFNSHQIKAESLPAGGFDESRYIDALLLDLQSNLPKVWGRRIHSIFFGGGTPSLLSVTGLDRLLSGIRALLPVNADAEITLEANPGTFEYEKFAGFANAGINRLSLGIQSFNDDHLQALGRIHDSTQARQAIRAATEQFAHVNIDLMYALPGQTLNQAIHDLENALAFGTDHLSLYHLTLEPNTLFAKYPPNLPDEDTAFAMQDELIERLAQAGYKRYEVSAFAKENNQCRHNLNYWQFGDYIGIGAGAHGKISNHQQIVRLINERHPDAYMEKIFSAGHAVIESRSLNKDDLPFEYMLNTLRLIEGAPTHLFRERTGLEIAAISSSLMAAVNKGLLDEDPRIIKATPLGMQYLNDLQMLFLH